MFTTTDTLIPSTEALTFLDKYSELDTRTFLGTLIDALSKSDLCATSDLEMLNPIHLLVPKDSQGNPLYSEPHLKVTLRARRRDESAVESRVWIPKAILSTNLADAAMQTFVKAAAEQIGLTTLSDRINLVAGRRVTSASSGSYIPDLFTLFIPLTLGCPETLAVRPAGTLTEVKRAVKHFVQDLFVGSKG